LLNSINIINIIFTIRRSITFKFGIYFAIFIIVSVDFTFIIVETLISSSKRTFAATWKIIDTYMKNNFILMFSVEKIKKEKMFISNCVNGYDYTYM